MAARQGDSLSVAKGAAFRRAIFGFAVGVFLVLKLLAASLARENMIKRHF